MSGGFEVTETVATVTPGVNNGGMDEEPERETSFQGQEEKKKVKVPRGIRVPLRVEDEIWDGESIPKSRHSECEAEQLQVEDCNQPGGNFNDSTGVPMTPDGNCNNRRYSGDFENSNRAGEEAQHENVVAAGRAAVGERTEFLEPSDCR